MAFTFSLATLLRLREIAEEREERLLGQILQQIAQTRQTLVDLQVKRTEVLARRERSLAQKIPSVELSGFYTQLRALDELQASGEQQLKGLEELRQRQMRVYEEAHRNRELLDSMKQDQHALFQQARVRREQGVMDDNFSARMISSAKAR